jgi:alcohol dehydrogenase (NADP+)
MKEYTLNDRTVMPAFGLGTWKSPKGEVKTAVTEAMRVGYRHIDAAWIYQNEQEVGEGIQEAIASNFANREDLFITSKLWNTFHQPEAVERGCEETLKALNLDYLDLYLIHWPIAFRPEKPQHNSPEDFFSINELPLSKTFEAMLTLREKGLVKSVGVSNCGISTLEKLINETGVVPAVNQVEMHPYNPQIELLNYCKGKGIRVTAYSPLGSSDRPDSMKKKDEPPLLENETVGAIAAQENLSPAQLLIAWGISRDTIVIPKSTNASRIAENLAAAAHTLSAAAKAALDDISIRYRYVTVDSWFIPGVTYEDEDFWS